MKAETEALLEECRLALLQQGDERIAALISQWFENLIGEEYLDEERDDLCLLLNYHVQSWGAPVSYATYTSWWEVEGYLEPSEGMFTCADLASLRQRLLDLPVKQFDLIVEMAYQARSALAELVGGPRLPTGWEGLREMAAWMAQADPASCDAELKRKSSLPAYRQIESKEQRRRREQERAALAGEQGYLVVTPDSSHAVADMFHHWCKEHAQPYILLETRGRQLALLRVQTRTVNIREIDAVLTRFQEQLPALVAPYIANAQAQGYQACLSWISRRQVTLEGILASDAQAVARAVVALWSTIQVEEKQREAEREALRKAELVPMWKRELNHLNEQEAPPKLPQLTEAVVLPAEWGELLTREQLSAFLSYLALPAGSRDAKAVLVQRVQERVENDQAVRALFFELFRRELAVPPWELEALLECTPTERKRWTDEGKLTILDQRSFRKAGSQKAYPVFDRRTILGLARTDLDLWRAEHQSLVKEHRSAAARAAAANRKKSLGIT